MDILEWQAVNIYDIRSRHIEELVADEDAQHLLLLQNAQ